MKYFALLCIPTVLAISLSTVAGEKAYVNFTNNSNVDVQTKYIDQVCMHNGKTGQFGDLIKSGSTKFSYFSSDGHYGDRACGESLSTVHFQLYPRNASASAGYNCVMKIQHPNTNQLTCQLVEGTHKPSFYLNSAFPGVKLDNCKQKDSPCNVEFVTPPPQSAN